MDRYVNALRQWDLPIGSWKVFLAHHPYVKFASRRSLRIEQRFGSPRPRSLGFQEIDSLQSNVVWYEAERVVCLYHQASLGANFMDAYGSYCFSASPAGQVAATDWISYCRLGFLGGNRC